MKLEELDNRIYHLLQSNKYFKQELEEGPDDDEDEDLDERAKLQKIIERSALREEYGEYIKENDDLINDKKNEVLRILQAFVKAGTNLDRDVLPKLKHRALYIPEFKAAPFQPAGKQMGANVQASSSEQAQERANQLHQAATFDQVIEREHGQAGSSPQ